MLWDYLVADGACWREEDGTTGNDEAQQVFLVDNSALNSRSKGLRYRRSPDLKDVDRESGSALFGTWVCGVSYDSEWVKVGSRFLPLRVQGHTVLVQQSNEGDEDASQVNTRLPARQRVEWRESAVQRAEELFDPLFEPGTGMLYEVVAERVAIRSSPAAEAPIQGCENRGTKVELFDWDETRRWRQLQRPADQEFKRADPRAWTLGWMMLDHEEHGPLLRPKGVPYQEQPLLPLCVSVHEDNLVNLQMFLLDGAFVDDREADGRTALMVATERARLDCCVLLLQARADPMLISPQGGNVLDYASESCARALLQALIAQLPPPSDEALMDAMERLQPETRQAARRLNVRAVEDRAIRARSSEQQVEEAERLRRAQQLRSEELRERQERERKVSAGQELRQRVHEQELARLERLADEERQRDKEEEERERQRRRLEKVALGELCEVRRDVGVEVRTEPRGNAELVGHEVFGQILQLHEYDRTGLWRRAFGHDFEGTLTGWALISDGAGAEWAVPCDEQ
mmetsp:Transcript_148261/g.476181  ORF Transcript_148261/g.476181 Transcript_148261/m.476181 type:complete len:517 (-) Transcript_148261:153-1703(-)